MKTLMVFLSDDLSTLIHKGEMTDRYYNPRNVFGAIHFVLSPGDHPNPRLLSRLVGDADVDVHHSDAIHTSFLLSCGWSPAMLARRAGPVISLAREVSPSIIRAYGFSTGAFVGSEVSQRLKIPFVLSLHGNPDVDYLRGRRSRSIRQKLVGRLSARMEIKTARRADHVIAVYAPIVPYLKKHRIRDSSIIYNAVGVIPESRKSDYRLARPLARALCVGRQAPLEKDPTPILAAVEQIPDVELLVIGDGPLHDTLVQRAMGSAARNRIRFVRTMPNQEVLRTMLASDFYVYASLNYELSKSCMEAALLGLPVVTSDRGGDPAPEVLAAGFQLCSNTPEGFAMAIRRLLRDHEYRGALGRAAYEYAWATFPPSEMEERAAAVYYDFLDQGT